MKTKNIKNKKKSRGYILIEATFCIFVVGLTLVAFIQVMSKMFVFEFNKRDSIIASNLAQEGIEIIRNIRDNNWKAGNDAFVAPFPVTDRTYRLAHNLSPTTSSVDTLKLRRHNTDGFYNYTSGTTTKFLRRVAVSGNGDSRTITSTVTWRPQGSSSDVDTVVEDVLYAWGNPD